MLGQLWCCQHGFQREHQEGGVRFDLAKACSSLLEINYDLVSIVTKRLSQQRGCLGTESICFIVGTAFNP